MNDHLKRATRAPGFRWCYGLDVYHETLGRVLVEGEPREGRPDYVPTTAGLQPSFKLALLLTPSSLGCLLMMVREVHGPGCYVEPANSKLGWWVVWLRGAGVRESIAAGDTEAEALITALETLKDNT